MRSSWDAPPVLLRALHGPDHPLPACGLARALQSVLSCLVFPQPLCPLPHAFILPWLLLRGSQDHCPSYTSPVSPKLVSGTRVEAGRGTFYRCFHFLCEAGTPNHNSPTPDPSQSLRGVGRQQEGAGWEGDGSVMRVLECNSLRLSGDGAERFGPRVPEHRPMSNSHRPWHLPSLLIH